VFHYAVRAAWVAMFCSGWSVRLSRARVDFRRVAFVGDLPFVVGLDEDGAGQAQQRRRIGEDADDVGAGV
jgi:hypothetical protein